MTKPIVAVVGRPNVGKSTLVNRISQSREAIVHESRGVTRDRSYHDADWNGRDFVIVDTGGIESSRSDDPFANPIREQAEAACDQANVILFLVDGSVGVTEEDEAVARVLRKSDKPVFLLVNKCDDPAREEEALWDFYTLGVGEPRALSALHGHGTGDLLDEIISYFPGEDDEVEEDDGLVNVAIIGRPNVGKSSLTNRIAGSERSIVSDVAGTTRDAVDILVEHDGQRFRLVDTAGMRKRNVVHEDIEYYGLVRGLAAIERADVCLLVVDATVGVTEQDQKVAGLAIERGCALVILLNKWDLMRDADEREHVMQSLARRMAFATWTPVLRISALTGRSVDRIWELVEAAAAAHEAHIPTSKLNVMLTQMRETGHTVVKGPKRLKVQYATQTGTKPPTFTFFCNLPELVDDNYERYVENRLRESFDLTGTPVRMRFRRKEQTS
ncbi:MAG: ribosome biogenesis GTPase Der [Atopobiaceae bacterium]|jgi:GTP-binding protein|nr:ribosome biogenesis GTPase Der [Atopobiaceae bacterium]MCH4180013.1 ribosome biogenesis GTPase Der [Atopobiaceae bacterium]MCH4213935.1 ribosome biogenesis GTPase Der [Atopobiaceae bacterium]MCH4229815.1 ribosome biogenesis GTPase Der [Atopobiaceae bacterium]MCH4275602.1 ribosome biogenesis GTPase Der [Atopobiaceae bacterium]